MHEHFARLAAAERLAVVSDFDGTLAPFHTDPMAVVPHPGAIDALDRLARLPRTTAAVLSGRHLDGLRQVCPLRAPVVLGGSHGAESSDAAESLTASQQEHLVWVEKELRGIVKRFPGAEIEVKPFQRVLHVLKLHLQDPAAAQAATDAALALDTRGFPRTQGKMVVEFSATRATKGSWLEDLRERVGATALVFLGDDVTDEHGFAVLGPEDLGVKVGAGETAAGLRVDDVDAVAEFLTQLADARGAATVRP